MNPVSPRRLRSWRMTDDKSIQNCGDEPHVGACSRACDDARERRGPMRDVAVSSHGRTPAARKRDRRCERIGNFPPCKDLKTHKMRKESRFCAGPRLGPVERVARMGKARRAAGGAHDPALSTRALTRVVGGLDRDPSLGGPALATPIRKFSAMQSLENSQNGKGIAPRLRGRVQRL